MNREYHRWFSPALQREMELLVFGHGGARTLVFPTRSGRFFDYENWGLVEALRPSIEAGNLQLYCVDSVDGESLYCGWKEPSSRIRRHLEYERYLIEEVVPFSERHSTHPFLIAHGCSLGAYHAVNIAFRHPQLFGKVVACSGRFDLTRSQAYYPGLFDDYYDETIYFHTPEHFVPNLRDPALLEPLRRMEITLAVGEADIFLESNRHLSGALGECGVSHALHLWEGEAHRARYWRRMVPLYL